MKRLSRLKGWHSDHETNKYYLNIWDGDQSCEWGNWTRRNFKWNSVLMFMTLRLGSDSSWIGLKGLALGKEQTLKNTPSKSPFTDMTRWVRSLGGGTSATGRNKWKLLWGIVSNLGEGEGESKSAGAVLLWQYIMINDHHKLWQGRSED